MINSGKAKNGVVKRNWTVPFLYAGRMSGKNVQIRRSFAEQPINEVFGFDALIGSVKPRLKGQHDFFVIITDALQRRKLPFPDVLAHHRLRYLNILFFVGVRCDEVHFGIADIAD